jgi:hypothetical protein
MVRRDYADVACGVADVDHISAVDPTTVLALLDQVERLQLENAQLSALIDIPELHEFAKGSCSRPLIGKPYFSGGVTTR